MSIRSILSGALRVGLAGVIGSMIGGGIVIFVTDFRPMDHGPHREFTLEAALAGVVFGTIAGLMYAFPVGAVLGGVLAAKKLSHAIWPTSIGWDVLATLVWIAVLFSI